MCLIIKEVMLKTRNFKTISDCQSLIGAHWTTRNIGRIELTTGGVGVRIFLFSSSKQQLWEVCKGFLMCFWNFKGFLIWKFLKLSLYLYLERLWAKNVGQIAFFWKKISKIS
ncbi:hypothetical protein ACB092_10G124600 [Castanea dentata]